MTQCPRHLARERAARRRASPVSSAARSVDLDVEADEMVAMVGPSGSDRSTVLNVISGIDRPTGGEVMVAGCDLLQLDQEEPAVWRGDEVVGPVGEIGPKTQWSRRGGYVVSRRGRAGTPEA